MRGRSLPPRSSLATQVFRYPPQRGHPATPRRKQVKIATQFFQIIKLRKPPPLFTIWEIYSVTPFGTVLATQITSPTAGKNRANLPASGQTRALV